MNNMPIELTEIKNTYRTYLPFGHYDLIIVSLVHQGPEMVYYMATNLQKYIKGSFMWIVHYNNSQHIDENTLPSWAWLVRDTIKTIRNTRLLIMAINQALKFMLVNVSSINIMTISSGSAFFREFIVPTEQKVSLITHEINIYPNINLLHVEEISIEHMGRCSEYLESIGSFGWQYRYGGDSDLDLHALVRKRGFKYLKGCQWPGQIWPYEVGKMLVEDLSEIENLNNTPSYASEEIYLSTYAYNYAKEKRINISFLEVYIDWDNSYEVKSVSYIDKLRNEYKKVSAICKLPDNISDTVRQYIITEQNPKSLKNV